MTEDVIMFLFGKVIFASLVPLDWPTLLATAHQRCMRLALDLGGSTCSAAAAEIPVQE